MPANIQQALVLRGGGSSWKDAAIAVGLDYRTLRRYIKQHPDAVEFLEEQTKDSLDQSHNTLIAAAPAVAQRLLAIALDPKKKLRCCVCMPSSI